MEEDLIFKKATLALGGGIKLPPGFTMPVRVSRSTAGPGAGNSSAAFSFHGMRVKKSISYDSGEFELHDDNGRLSLTRNGEPFLDEVTIEPVVYHCPEQAFFTLDSRCSYRCAFCASPRLPKSDFKGLTDEDITRKCVEAARENRIVAVSLTSGVYEGDVQAEIDRFVSCVRSLRRELPDMPIGLEPYAETEDQIRALKEAGADEIKLNVQAATDDIFRRVCPDLDRDRIFECLGHAVRHFGRGRVTSNIIFGMGETLEELEACMERICRIGAIPTVRSLRYSTYNTESLREAIGTPEKVTPEHMIRVAEMHKRVLERNGMDTNTCRTMCLECRCCDLVPHRDL
ncbi:MAG: radical SAM protein [archaeon]|nr:radical SAM protein [archaeon]